MKRTRFNHIFLEIFGVNIYWIRCSRRLYSQRIRDEFNIEAPKKKTTVAATMEIYYKLDQPMCVLWFGPASSVSSVAHECFHAAHCICDERGIWLTDSSAEIYAYLIEFIFNAINPARKR